MLKMVIAVRTDLNMRKGKIAAQVAHATQEVILDRTENVRLLDYPFVLDWLAGDYTKIVVQAPDETELFNLQFQAAANGLLHHVVYDLGKTEFKGVKTPTCIAIGPGEASEIDMITGHLRLL